VRLLERTTRTQRMTEARRAYYERVKLILGDVERADEAASAYRRAPRGPLRIASSITFGVRRLAPALRAFFRRCPEVTVTLELLNEPVDLVRSGYDAVFGFARSHDLSVTVRPLLPYRMVLCAAPGYLQEHPKLEKLRDLTHHACLGFSYWKHRDQWRFAGPDRTEMADVRGPLISNSGHALVAAALSGLGVIMQPEMLVEEELKLGRLVRVLPEYMPPTRTLALMYRPDLRLPAKLRSFVDFSLESFAVNESS
jgi:DNA-binding transcriptional LysR family regulator